VEEEGLVSGYVKMEDNGVRGISAMKSVDDLNVDYLCWPGVKGTVYLDSFVDCRVDVVCEADLTLVGAQLQQFWYASGFSIQHLFSPTTTLSYIFCSCSFLEFLQ
jgi:hypothetical protein